MGCVIGLISGVMGGVSTVHGPPLIMYVVSLRLEKEEFVAALGSFFLMGSILIAVAYVEQGVLNGEIAPWSLLCAPPALAGMWLGRRLSSRIDRDRFRKNRVVRTSGAWIKFAEKSGLVIIAVVRR